MRICCVIGPYLPVPPLLGGAVEKIFLALCEAFAAKGHEVTMISRRFAGLPHRETRNGVRHVRLRSRDRPSNSVAYRLFDLVYALRVCAALPPSDITITHSVALPLIIPHRRAGRIYVGVARYPKGQMALYRRVDRLQACSTHIGDAIRRQAPSVAHLVKAIPNAITDVFAARTLAPRQRERAKEIVFVGRIAREKGIDLLVKAFCSLAARHPDWRLRIVGPHLASQGGDGAPFLAELETLGAGAGDAITFTGPVFDESTLADFYERAAIFVYPSVAERGEAFPLAPLEAMACGCVPVISDLRCFDDALTPDENAIAFDHRDASGAPLAAALERLIASPALRDAIAARAHERSRDYVPTQVADLFLEDFRTLLADQLDSVARS